MQDWTQIREWRRAQRTALVDRRMAVSPETLKKWNGTITGLIETGFPMLAGMTVGFCWPYKHEFDARFVIRRLRDHGANAALPVVVEKKGPLQFRKWWPGAPMKAGVYDIPFPDGTELVVPDAAIVPMNGFDGQGYRLGYGGGYFDRTLASCLPRPLAIGVSFEFARLHTIHPQSHDIAMDFVVTEAGLHAADGSSLARITSEECGTRAQRLCEQRGLPRARQPESGGLSSPVCYANEFPGYSGETDAKKT